MSTLASVRPESENTTAPDIDTGIVHEQDGDAACRACPVCGSSATYQTPNGRWGCTQCGSTWA